MITPFGKTASAALVLVLCASVPAHAQTPGQASQAVQQLRLNGSWSGGYDGNIYAETVGAVDPRFDQGGVHTGGGFGLLFSRHRGRVDLGGETNSSFRLYRTKENSVTSSHNLSGNAGADLTSRIRIQVSGNAQYSPTYQIEEFAELIEVGHLRVHYFTVPRRVIATEAIASVRYQLGKKSSLHFLYAGRQTKLSGGNLDLASREAGGRYTRALTQHASLNLGYASQRGHYGSNSVIHARTIDAGISYNRALAVSRRTIVEFAFGTSGVENARRVMYQPTGQASIARRLTANWVLKSEYQRAMSFVGGFHEPLLLDSLTVGTLGKLSRTSSVQFQAGYTNGRLGVTSGNNLAMSYGGARFQSQVGRTLVAFAESFYYYYGFDNTGRVEQSLTRMKRTVARAGLQISLPLLRERDANATR